MSQSLSTCALAFLLTIQACSQENGKTPNLKTPNERTTIMQISFVKSGGFAGPMTRVQGTINLKDDRPDISGDAGYHRELKPDEVATLRAAAQPEVLSQAANRMAAAKAVGGGAADLEHFNVTVTTGDGKRHEMAFNMPGSPTEKAALPPEATKFLSWLQEQAQDILTQKMKSK